MNKTVLDLLTLTRTFQRLIQELEIAANGARIALVGGIVRDWLLHRIHRDPWIGPGDLDLVVEFTLESGVNAHSLAKELVTLHPHEIISCHYHDNYGTVEVKLGGVPIDLATARQESYPNSGSNPIINFSSLENDLARRDFRLNAIAIVLKQGRWELLDPYKGEEDLATGLLEFLHDNSIVDDPTRLIRAARYSARLGMTLSEKSLQQVKYNLQRWPWNWKPDDSFTQIPSAFSTRLRMELELLLKCTLWRFSLQRLQNWGALVLLDEDLQFDKYWQRRLIWAERLEISLLLALMLGAKDPVRLANRLQLPEHQIHWLEQVKDLQEFFYSLKREKTLNSASISLWLPSRWCRELEERGWSPEVIALALISGIQPRRPLLRWLFRWRHIYSPLTANEIIIKGVFIGPKIGNYLRQLRWYCIDATG